MTYGDCYREAVRLLADNGVREAGLDARLLLESVCGTDRNTLLAHPDREVSTEEKERFDVLVQRRCKREPLQYIINEQEFMTAAEATGISIRRRVFKHLIPNVIPQLVVWASMDIGNVILAESTLSFLGLGIKYPSASWGSIINAVTDPYIMANYPLVWIPAGTFILLTVLAFNFVGDGLRDAFDPKMKR